MSQKTALVTGASSGMGKEIARQLLADGLTVYVVARRIERMSDLEAAGAIPLAMDITVADDVEAVVARITQDAGGVDVLINNAGFGLFGPVEEISIDDARYQFEVNLFGLARITQLVLPHMRSAGAGTIVNIGSMGGRIYTPLGAWYHATKHALEGWTDCLRYELDPFGINVVLIEPGAILTEWGAIMADRMEQDHADGAYAAMVQSVVEGTRAVYSKGKSSPPEVVARVVGRAVAARRPRTRYPTGKYARPLLFARRWLSDRMFDRLMRSQY